MSARRAILGLLTVILAFNYTDRFALGLVLQNVKTDLVLTDTQLGVLSGIAFAVLYATMGIPIAMWADRGNRVRIVALTTATWSVAVALCGACTSFVQLLGVRTLAGIGEAGCVPPAHSLIADYFPRADRARAMALYLQGISGSLLLGYFAAGWLNELYGWRMMFVVIGLPGLALAVIARLCLVEPKREESVAAATGTESRVPGLARASADLWRNRTFRHLLMANSILYFFSYGTLQWTPSFLTRDYGLSTGAIGTWLALVYGIGGALGTYWGGEWAARHARHDEARQLRAMAVVTVASAVLTCCAYLPQTSTGYPEVLGWLALANVVGIMANGPLFAVIQTLVPPQLRARSIAIVYLFANLIGLGCGPWATGALSDALRPWAGAESLRYALLLLSPGFLWGAWHLSRAAKTVRADLCAVDRQPDEPASDAARTAPSTFA